MKYLSRFIIVGLILLLALPVMAQEEGAGEGGTIVQTYSSGDPAAFIPLIYVDAMSGEMIDRLYPSVFGIDPFTGLRTPGNKGTLATGWEYDETGTVLTVTIREDAFWNDGVQITTADVIWSLNALRSGQLDGARGVSTWDVMDDGTEGSGPLVDAYAVDDFTFVLEFKEPDCIALNDVFTTIVPAHVFEEAFGDDLSLINDDPQFFGGVSWAVWTDPELIPGDRVNFVPDPSFPDTELGYVSPEALVWLSVPDQDIEFEMFLAGDSTISGVPGDRQSEIEANEAYQTYRYMQNGFNFAVFNSANPDNPQGGYDEDGNYIEQDPHPVLGNKLVRQALVYAVDMDAIIENTMGGNAVNIGTYALPLHWHYDDSLIYPFDQERAGELLDEAGWVMEEGNEYRVCRGCAYTAMDADYEGTEMALTFATTTGASDLVQQRFDFMAQSWRDVGINVAVEPMDWSTAYFPALMGQTFDIMSLQWSSLGLPVDPDATGLFTTDGDIPDVGWNFGSYHNLELDQIYLDARNPALTDGCTVEGRLPFYQQASQILFDEVPYLFMTAPLRMTAVQAYHENWNPAPFTQDWDEDAWVVIAPGY